jgi:hypothetical protein
MTFTVDIRLESKVPKIDRGLAGKRPSYMHFDAVVLSQDFGDIVACMNT